MSIRRSASAAALLIAIGATPVFADMDAAKKWVDSEFQPSTLSKEQQLKEMEWFIEGRRTLQGHRDQRAVGRHPDAPLRGRGPDQGLRGDHRDQGQPPDPRRRRGRPGGSDADADEPQSLRRLCQRLRPDRHPFAPAERRQPDRLDGGRRQGRDQPDARYRRLHGQVVHHRAGWQAVAVARPAVRQSLLVPQGLVRPPGSQGQVQGQVRLRARRAGQLVGL